MYIYIYTIYILSDLGTSLPQTYSPKMVIHHLRRIKSTFTKPNKFKRLKCNVLNHHMYHILNIYVYILKATHKHEKTPSKSPGQVPLSPAPSPSPHSAHLSHHRSPAETPRCQWGDNLDFLAKMGSPKNQKL